MRGACAEQIDEGFVHEILGGGGREASGEGLDGNMQKIVVALAELSLRLIFSSGKAKGLGDRGLGRLRKLFVEDGLSAERVIAKECDVAQYLAEPRVRISCDVVESSYRHRPRESFLFGQSGFGSVVGRWSRAERGGSNAEWLGAGMALEGDGEGGMFAVLKICHDG